MEGCIVVGEEEAFLHMSCLLCWKLVMEAYTILRHHLLHLVTKLSLNHALCSRPGNILDLHKPAALLFSI